MPTKRLPCRPSSFLDIMRRRLSAESGFTLVELLVTMVVASVISAAVITALFTLTDTFDTQQTRMINQDDARTAIEQISHYIREATSSADNTTSQSNSVLTAQPSNIEFYADVDGAVDSNGQPLAEKVRYYLDGTNLRMQTARPSLVTSPTPHYVYPTYETNGTIVQNGVRNGSTAVFTYYQLVDDPDHPGTKKLQAFSPSSAADLRQVVAVNVNLSINERPAKTKSNVQLTMKVQIRQRFYGGIDG